MKTKELTKSAIFIVLIAVCAQITIPMPLIPFTLQVFAITLLGLTLSPKHAIYTLLVYILAGLIGIPVFANGQAGIGMILKPSFAFILGFIPFVANIKKNPFIAWILLYLIALPILYFNLKVLIDLDINVFNLLKLYWFTFIPTDFISIFFAKKLVNRLPK